MSNSNIIKFLSHPTVIRGTSVSLSEGLRPMRIVLRDDGRQFIVHTELLTVSVETQLGPMRADKSREWQDLVTCTHDAFDQGSYFQYGDTFLPTKEEALKSATKVYEERSRNFGR